MMANTRTPNRLPIASAYISPMLLLRPRLVKSPCNSSTIQPSVTPARNTSVSGRSLRAGLAQSHRNEKMPNNTKCAHLSASGMFTSGNSLPGIKHKIKMSKVQATASHLALFLYRESFENILLMLIRPPARGKPLHPSGLRYLRGLPVSFLSSNPYRKDPG